MRTMRVLLKICTLLLLAGLLSGGQFACLAESAPESDNITVEAFLSELGFFTEVPDETCDRATNIALGNFQTANGLELSGEADSETLDKLFFGECTSKQEYLAQTAQRYGALLLEEGSSGQEVMQLQDALIALGYYDGTADGVFGAATGESVARFQAAVGLQANGRGDGATLYRLFEGSFPDRDAYIASMCAQKSDSGRHVQRAQQTLLEMGYFTGECTGTYGDMTVRAVEAFQAANGLMVTGRIDTAECELLYSNKAVTILNDGVLRPGDSGEAVRALQGRLSELGYYKGPASGKFDAELETALCLYEIAAGLEANGEASQDMQAQLFGESAIALTDASLTLKDTQAQVGGSKLEQVRALTENMLGREFAAQNNSLFPGFSLIQYVYAGNGIAFTDPGEIISRTSVYQAGAEIEAGNIVVLEHASDESVQLRLTISLGGGRLAFLDDSGKWVVSGKMSQMRYQNAYVWTVNAGDGEDAGEEDL